MFDTKQLFEVRDSHDSSILVASCLGESSGGGLISYDGKAVDVIDTISSTGLFVAEGRFVRLLWCRWDYAAPGELLVYDSTGVQKYYRIDSLSDPHDVVWDGKHYVVVSAGENSILWISPSGDLVRRKQFPGEADSWHLNSLLLHRGGLFAAAFGRFGRYREWMDHAGKDTGIVFDCETDRAVLTGLDRPHHPRLLEDSWILCNSGKRELLELDCTSGRPIRKLELEQWPRGLVLSNRYIFIGESARRGTRETEDMPRMASISILERATWKLIEKVPLPFEEIYDLVLVPVSLLQGLRKGFKTNPQRILEQDQHALFRQIGVTPSHLWATGDKLPEGGCAAQISVEIEPVLGADSVLKRPCVIENRGNSIFTSAKPNPVVISYKWVDKDRQHLADPPLTTKLPCSLPPRISVACKFRLQTPSKEGDYELQVSLFQRGWGFFGDLDASNIFKTNIRITKTLMKATGLPAHE